MVDRALEIRTEYAVRTFAKRLIKLAGNLRRYGLVGFGRLIKCVPDSNLGCDGEATPGPGIAARFLKMYDI